MWWRETFGDAEAFAKIFAAICAGLAVVLVPISGALKEWFSHRTAVAEAASHRSEAVVGSVGPLLGDSMAIDRLAEALTKLAEAIENDTKSDERLASDKVAQMLAQVVGRLNGPPA